MKHYVIERKMKTTNSGYYVVVVEGETHLNRNVIKSDIQFFTTESGYSFAHPESKAKEFAQAIADGLNEYEKKQNLSCTTPIPEGNGESSADNKMIMANAAQVLVGFVWKNELPSKIMDGSRVDKSALLEYLLKFQIWVYDMQPNLAGAKINLLK